MKKLTKAAAALALSAAAIVGCSTAGFFVAMASAPTVSPKAPDVGSPYAVDHYPVNAQGQTYGMIDQGLAGDPEARAELIAVTTDDGKEGYAYGQDLFAPVPSGPDEAATLSDEPYEVPVYELDGRTLIGVHTVNRPAGR